MLLRELEDFLYIARDRCGVRNLDLCVEHAECTQKLGVLDDGIRAMAACAPHRDHEAETGLVVSGPVGVLFDPLTLGGYLAITGVNVPLQVCRAVVGAGTSERDVTSVPLISD